MKKKPVCWCGRKLIDAVEGFQFGFLNCPEHTCFFEPEDKKRFTKQKAQRRSNGSYDDDKVNDFDTENAPFHIKIQSSAAVIEVLHQ